MRYFSPFLCAGYELSPCLADLLSRKGCLSHSETSSVTLKGMPKSQRNLLRNSQSASCPQTNPTWLYNVPSPAFLSPAKDNDLLQIKVFLSSVERHQPPANKVFLSSTERQQPPANKVFLEVRWTAYRKWVRRQSDRVVACRIVRQTHGCRLSNGHF